MNQYTSAYDRGYKCFKQNEKYGVTEPDDDALNPFDGWDHVRSDWWMQGWNAAKDGCRNYYAK